MGTEVKLPAIPDGAQVVYYTRVARGAEVQVGDVVNSSKDKPVHLLVLSWPAEDDDE